MSGNDPVSKHAMQQEIDDLREQAMLLPPGRKRNRVLAKADALEVTMKAFSWSASPALQPPRRIAIDVRLTELSVIEPFSRLEIQGFVSG
jgi:hypothetical protein